MGKFDKFNDKVKELAKEVENVQNENGTGEYKEVEYGIHDVAIDKLELGLTKAGDKPMLKVWFKILAGEYENSIIFMNQVVTLPFQIHIANEFLKSLKSELEIKFVDYNQYADLIDKIYDEITKKYEYALDYDKNDKGYNTFKITDVFQKED